MHYSTKHSAERERTLAAIRYDIAARIRPLCVGWIEADIVALVERMALIKYKYDTAQSDLLSSWTASRGNGDEG